MGTEGSESHVEVDAKRIPEDKPLGVIHTGTRYAFGFGPSYYGIWDQVFSGPPHERFPPTAAGKMEGWQRYTELEPSVGESRPPWLSPPEEAETQQGRARRWIVLGAVLAVVVSAVVFTQLGGDEGPGENGEGPVVANTAHVSVTGAVTFTGDMDLQEFEIRGPRTLLPRFDARWTGGNGELFMTVTLGEVGENRTNENPPRRIELTFQPAVVAQPLTFVSRTGQCTITLTRYEDALVEGSFICAEITLEELEGTLEIEGDFSASS